MAGRGSVHAIRNLEAAFFERFQKTEFVIVKKTSNIMLTIS